MPPPIRQLAACLALACALVGAAQDPALAAVTEASVASDFTDHVRPLLDTYCSQCHGAAKQKGDLNLATYASASEAMRTRKVWKSVSTKLVEKDMPPEEESKQPSPAERQAIVSWVTSLKGLDRPDPGRSALHRLNRIEYGYTIRDLLGVDVQAGEDFPKDDVSDGFDNIADTLSLSPFLMEKYLLSADAILDRVLFADTVVLRAGAAELDMSSEGKTDPGVPGARERLFTASGALTRALTLPVTGAYTVAVRAGADQNADLPVRVAISIDGQVLGESIVAAPTTQPGVITCTAPLTAGMHRCTITVRVPAPAGAVQASGSAIDQIAYPSHRRTVLIETVEILAPAPDAADERTRTVLVAMPGHSVGKREAATTIARQFASRAYRRPASKEQITLLLRVFDLADQQGRSFTRSIKEMLKTVLVAPEFLFRIEQERAGDKDGNYLIDDYDLAGRLSYFLWSSLPDDTLLALAANGTLHEPAVERAQVQRMIADSKIQRFIDNFAGQWLLLRNLLSDGQDGGKSKDPIKKAAGLNGLSEELRQAMFDEGTGLFGHILRDGCSLADFIDPGYTFLNAALATHYGIPGVVGDQMRLVRLTDHRRGGVLTLGALLAVNSHPERTSPTRRGRWVLEEVIGKPPPPPPPDIPQLQFVRKANPKATEREILEIHRAKPMCASCHRVMDPIGFGLENFDNQGRWRETLKDAPIDASGELPGKKAFNGPAELKHLIAEHTDDLARVLSQRVMTYALGRALHYADDDAIDSVVAKTAAANYRFDTIITEVALSFPFRYRKASP
jgi:mono/diheme cytochrome c family protein